MKSDVRMEKYTVSVSENGPIKRLETGFFRLLYRSAVEMVLQSVRVQRRLNAWPYVLEKDVCVNLKKPL